MECENSRDPLPLLLAGFAAASVGALLLTFKLTVTHGEEARHAYGPADFPAIYAKDVALEGLANLGTETAFVVPGPPLDKDTFPCSQCHDNKDLKVNPEPRAKLRDPHEKHFVKHGDLWCLSCHDALDRDRLHLANGKFVELTNPVQLCAQCHGAKARDWAEGLHGRRSGYWDGKKRMLMCVVCHDPHNPHFQPIEPLPPPVRPNFARSTPEETR